MRPSTIMVISAHDPKRKSRLMMRRLPLSHTRFLVKPAVVPDRAHIARLICNAGQSNSSRCSVACIYCRRAVFRNIYGNGPPMARQRRRAVSAAEHSSNPVELRFCSVVCRGIFLEARNSSRAYLGNSISRLGMGRGYLGGHDCSA